MDMMDSSSGSVYNTCILCSTNHHSRAMSSLFLRFADWVTVPNHFLLQFANFCWTRQIKLILSLHQLFIKQSILHVAQAASFMCLSCGLTERNGLLSVAYCEPAFTHHTCETRAFSLCLMHVSIKLLISHCFPSRDCFLQ